MGEVIPHLHLMEQVSSSEHIGTMAENLLRVLSENETVHAQVNFVIAVKPSMHKIVTCSSSHCRLMRCVLLLELRRNARPWR